ncbi:sensor histidine kinase [Methanocella sp. MCL-LM]|uniref:sensor histidine kinase n=1 Tax=Methanocella sp. MCL-LM TaxID=3412035 RepID=UPI003C7664E2
MFRQPLPKLSTLKIVLIYTFFGALWILFSDVVLQLFSNHSSAYTALSILKGWLYVAVTSLLLFLLIYRYVSERKRVEESLADEKAQAELYLDVMGHDITNINQIGIGYLELAQETLRLDDEGRDLLQKPLDALKNSSRLIENVRKLKRARQGKPSLAKVNVARVMQDVIAAGSHHPGRDIQISYDGCDCYTMADDLLPDVFSSIIESAVNNSTGPLHIGIRVAGACMDTGEYCFVSLEDDGPGIPDTVKKDLFVRIPGVAQISGGVLGLYLAWTLIKGYEGKLWVEDRVPGDYHKGSRFVVILPAVR